MVSISLSLSEIWLLSAETSDDIAEGGLPCWLAVIWESNVMRTLQIAIKKNSLTYFLDLVRG